MWSFSALLVAALLALALLPASVSANAGPDTVGDAGAVGGPAWAAPAAILATLRSLSLALQSLFTRLASARLARGDLAGKWKVLELVDFSDFVRFRVLFVKFWSFSWIVDVFVTVGMLCSRVGIQLQGH